MPQVIPEIPAKKKSDQKKKSKSAPSGAGRRGRKPTHVKYRQKMYTKFTLGKWDELGRKLRKVANREGLRP